MKPLILVLSFVIFRGSITPDYEEEITATIVAYVGRFHVYPASGQDILSYADEREKYLRSEYPMIPSHKYAPIRKRMKKIFLSPKCIYADTLCIIPYKKKTITVHGPVSRWQNSDYLKLLYNYKTAFYDDAGNYLMKESDHLGDSYLYNELGKYCEQYPLCLNFPAYFKDLNYTKDISFRIRVQYKRGEHLILAEQVIPPAELYVSQNDETRTRIRRIISMDEDMISSILASYEPFFSFFLEEHPNIAVIDALIPVYINDETATAEGFATKKN